MDRGNDNGMQSFGFEKSDEIITVSNSFIATCGAIAHYGSKPILIDVDHTYNIDINLIKKKLTKKPRQ